MAWLACTFSQRVKRLPKSAVKIALSIWPTFLESEAQQRILRCSPEIKTTFNSAEPRRRLESKFLYGFLYIHLNVRFYSFQYFSMVYVNKKLEKFSLTSGSLWCLFPNELRCYVTIRNITKIILQWWMQNLCNTGLASHRHGKWETYNLYIPENILH